MNPKKPKSRRQRITIRAKVRKKKKGRTKFWTGVFFGVVAGVAGLQWGLRYVRVPSLTHHESFYVKQVELRGEVGTLKPALTTYFKKLQARHVGFFEPGRFARNARRNHPALKRVTVRRNWIDKQIIFDVSVRPALALLAFEGLTERVPRFLGFDGEVFTAPVGMYGTALPKLHIPRSYRKQLESDRRRLASFLLGWQQNAENRIGELRSVTVAGLPEGITLKLRDGTRIFWGEMNHLRDKVRRFSQAVDLHRARYAGRISVDLRNFLDGKIYIRSPEEDS